MEKTYTNNYEYKYEAVYSLTMLRSENRQREMSVSLVHYFPTVEEWRAYWADKRELAPYAGGWDRVAHGIMLSPADLAALKLRTLALAKEPMGQL